MSERRTCIPTIKVCAPTAFSERITTEAKFDVFNQKKNERNHLELWNLGLFSTTCPNPKGLEIIAISRNPSEVPCPGWRKAEYASSGS